MTEQHMENAKNVYDLLARLSHLLIEHEQSNQREFQRLQTLVEHNEQTNQQEFARLRQLVDSNAKAIQALADRG